MSGDLRPDQVLRALLTYTDRWQPSTASLLEVGGARRGSSYGDGMHPDLLVSLAARGELARRMGLLEERERQVLFLWYVRQLPAHEIAREVGVSRRQCFRIRSAAMRLLLEDDVTAA